MSTTLPRRAYGAQRAEDPRLQQNRDLYHYGKARWTRDEIALLVIVTVVGVCALVVRLATGYLGAIA